MTDLFISYSRKDERFARQLAESLSEAGIDVWIDVDDIPAGMKWSTAVQRGLALCEVMVVVITPEAMASRNVEDEWQYYLDQGKPVVPVLRKPASIHFQLNRIQRIDFYAQPYETALQHLYIELESLGVKLKPGTITERPTGTIGRRPASFPTRPPKKRSQMPLILLALAALAVVIAGSAFLILRNSSTPTPAATVTPTATPTETATFSPTETAGATPTVISTPAQQVVTLTATDPVNVRMGDDRAFPLLYTLNRGEQATVIGVNRFRQWWYIEYTNRQTGALERGWVSNLFVTIEGDTDSLPVMTANTLPDDNSDDDE
jgi:hypothetical protein